MPYICQIREDIPEGVLQVLDLTPNTSQRNLIYEPAPQTKYVRRLQNDTVATSGADPIVTAATYRGLAAYLIANVQVGAAGPAFTAAQANAAAAGLVAILDAGDPLDIASVNAALAAAAAGASLTANDSTGVLADVLKILAGAEYVLPVGSTVEVAGAFTPATGTFTVGQYRATYEAGALSISLGEGALSVLTSASFVYSKVAGAAVVVLADDGTVL